MSNAITLPTTLCRGCQVATAEFPSIYCEGCLEEMGCAEEAHDSLGVESEELEEGFQVVSPRGILQRSIHNVSLSDRLLWAGGRITTWVRQKLNHH